MGNRESRCPPPPVRLASRISTTISEHGRESRIVTSTRTRENYPKTGIFVQVHTRNPHFTCFLSDVSTSVLVGTLAILAFSSKLVPHSLVGPPVAVLLARSLKNDPGRPLRTVRLTAPQEQWPRSSVPGRRGRASADTARGTRPRAPSRKALSRPAGGAADGSIQLL